MSQISKWDYQPINRDTVREAFIDGVRKDDIRVPRQVAGMWFDNWLYNIEDAAHSRGYGSGYDDGILDNEYDEEY